MSIKVMASVWEHSQASGTDLLVLLALADNANDSGECWPSIGYIARKCRVDKSTIRRRITSLEELGEVIVIRGGGKASTPGGTRSNKYRIVVHMVDEETEEEGSQSATPWGGTDARGGVAPMPGGGVAPMPPEPSLRTVIEPPLNPQPTAGDQSHVRRGTRGSGTSPRELRAVEQQARAHQRAEDEADRLVTAIPETYGHLPEDYVLSKIDEGLGHDPVRRQRAIEHYRSMAVAS
jgi:hypothetical protein